MKKDLDLEVLAISLLDSPDFTTRLHELETWLGMSTATGWYEMVRRAVAGDEDARATCAVRMVLEDLYG
jgi:hypothetical protein